MQTSDCFECYDRERRINPPRSGLCAFPQFYKGICGKMVTEMTHGREQCSRPTKCNHWHFACREHHEAIRKGAFGEVKRKKMVTWVTIPMRGGDGVEKVLKAAGFELDSVGGGDAAFLKEGTITPKEKVKLFQDLAECFISIEEEEE